MAYQADQASLIADLVRNALSIEDLKSSRFHMQTDAVQLAFAVAQMEAQDGCRAVMVDGLIKTSLQTKALNHKGGPQAFFSLRCHEKGLTCRRVVFLDYKSTRTMSTRATGEGLLHYHGVFLIGPEKSDEVWLRKKMTAVFGHAGNARKKQFNIEEADQGKGRVHKGRHCVGMVGKLSYMLSHVGTTCSRLGMNEAGKRSRSAPLARRRANAGGQGWAKGDPSNFVPKKALIWDTETRRVAQEAFRAWYASQRPERAQSVPVGDESGLGIERLSA